MSKLEQVIGSAFVLGAIGFVLWMVFVVAPESERQSEIARAKRREWCENNPVACAKIAEEDRLAKERQAKKQAAEADESAHRLDCEVAIKERLRNPSSASIKLEGSQESLWGTQLYFQVRAQNGFGGMSVERWECYVEDGQTKAMPI